MADRVLQTSVAAFLEPALEKEFEDCSFAYRRGRSVRMAIERIYQLHLQGYTWVVDADIDHFFDNIDRDLVLGRLAQGSVVSPMLANLCLDSFDEQLLHSDCKLVRYSDDFVILARSQKSAQAALELTTKTLDGLRLKLKNSKTRVVRFADGFRFLGVIFMKDLLLQQWKPGGAKRKILSVAPPLPESLFPQTERRPLRKYKAI